MRMYKCNGKVIGEDSTGRLSVLENEKIQPGLKSLDWIWIITLYSMSGMLRPQRLRAADVVNQHQHHDMFLEYSSVCRELRRLLGSVASAAREQIMDAQQNLMVMEKNQAILNTHEHHVILSSSMTMFNALNSVKHGSSALHAEAIR